MLEDSKGGLTPTFRTRPFVEIVGDKFEVRVKPEEGYGEYNENMGELHKTDENGNRYKMKFVTMLARKK